MAHSFVSSFKALFCLWHGSIFNFLKFQSNEPLQRSKIRRKSDGQEVDLFKASEAKLDTLLGIKSVSNFLLIIIIENLLPVQEIFKKVISMFDSRGIENFKPKKVWFPLRFLNKILV